MPSDLFQHGAITLLRECFEGRAEGNEYTWFVEKKEGIFDALESVEAAKASIKPSPRCATLAAHAYHVLYALQHTNGYLGRPKPEGDWQSSWRKDTVTNDEWQELKAKIRDEYEFFLKTFEAQTTWDNQETVTGFTAQIPHMAFHLGAMRQIMNIV
jgi:hypothetical protein